MRCGTSGPVMLINRKFDIRAGLKPMQLHWAPRLSGPRAKVFEKIVRFCQILLALEDSVETAHKPHF